VTATGLPLVSVHDIAYVRVLPVYAFFSGLLRVDQGYLLIECEVCIFNFRDISSWK